MKRLILLATLTLIAATAAFADIARPENTPKPPKPAKSWNGRMSIQTHANVGVATLSIRKDKLKELRAALDEADDRENNTAAVTSPNMGRGQTIMAGVLLSLGLVLGGFVFFKKTSRSVRIAASIALVSLVGIGGFTVFADIAPPREASLTSAIFTSEAKANGKAWGPVVIQVIDSKTSGYGSRDDVILQIPDEDGHGGE